MRLHIWFPNLPCGPPENTIYTHIYIYIKVIQWYGIVKIQINIDNIRHLRIQLIIECGKYNDITCYTVWLLHVYSMLICVLCVLNIFLEISYQGITARLYIRW